MKEKAVFWRKAKPQFCTKELSVNETILSFVAKKRADKNLSTKKETFCFTVFHLLNCCKNFSLEWRNLGGYLQKPWFHLCATTMVISLSCNKTMVFVCVPWADWWCRSQRLWRNWGPSSGNGRRSCAGVGPETQTSSFTNSLAIRSVAQSETTPTAVHHPSKRSCELDQKFPANLPPSLGFGSRNKTSRIYSRDHTCASIQKK